MIAIKSDVMKQMPEYCDDCAWYGSRPHPYKGWTELCELMGHCMDDDQEEEWIYDGNSRPKACPLIEITDASQTNCDSCAESGSYKCTKCDGEMYYKDAPHTNCDTCRHYKLTCELFSEICKYEPKADTPQITLCRECDDYAGNGMYCASNHLVYDFSTSKENCEAEKRSE